MNTSYYNALRDIKKAIIRTTYQSPSGVLFHGFNGGAGEYNLCVNTLGVICDNGPLDLVLPFEYISCLEISEPAFPYKEELPTITFYLKP